jgi:hypothetical protein
MARPEAIVVLSHQSLDTATADGGTYLDRLEETVQYVGRIEVAIGCKGREGKWSVDYIVGPRNSSLPKDVATAFPQAMLQLVEVIPVARR